jgi:predicted nucleotidyltransferase
MNINKYTQEFIEELKEKPSVLGVVLFGSWARGNNRPNSDVDLVVILNEGYRRIVEYRYNQAFEIIYITAKSALEFWQTNRDDCAGLWSVAKVLYDKDGTIRKLQEDAWKIINEGKKVIDSYQVKQFRFSVEDGVFVAESIMDKDFATANLLLQKNIIFLTELFFDLRQLWIPSAKLRLKEIEKIKPELHSLFVTFYDGETSLKCKIDNARNIINSVFDV